jgi:transcriptional regulator with XRE-family HTH domain
MFKIKIKQYRKLMRWTQKELARRSHLTQQHISNLEKEPREESPTLNTLENVASALKICPLELLECQCDLCKNKRGA